METTTLKMFSDTIKNENGLIWITPVCDFFNLHVQNQYSKIKNDPILSKLVGKNRPDSAQNENLVGKNHTDLVKNEDLYGCLLYTSPSPRDGLLSRMPSSA